MLSTIHQLLEQRDTKTLTQALLHSSRWLLGERLHYGPIQQRGLMANWLDIMNRTDSIEQCVTLQSGNIDAGVYCLTSSSISPRTLVTQPAQSDLGLTNRHRTHIAGALRLSASQPGSLAGYLEHIGGRPDGAYAGTAPARPRRRGCLAGDPDRSR